MTSVFSGEVLKKPKERQILPEKAQKNIHKNVQKKVQQLSAQEVEKCIEACVTGCKVQHRKYGTGEIISGDGRIAEILFWEKTRHGRFHFRSHFPRRYLL